jgi:hypothetical protein
MKQTNLEQFKDTVRQNPQGSIEHGYASTWTVNSTLKTTAP